MRLKKCLAALLMLVLLAGCVPAMAAYDKPYYIEVDLTNQITTIYNTKDKSIVRQMLCSTGAPGHETITGTYYLPAKDRHDERSSWYSFYVLGVYAQYATRISGPYLFHSIPCYKKSAETVVPRYVREFGMPASHGCVRLRVEDAEFIAKKCKTGTRVEIFYGKELKEDLRQLLYISSYTGKGGMTYKEFLGISPDALSSGSTGTQVLDLQYRLADLGYYDGKTDGKYGNATIAAVKKLQGALGLAETGITSDSLYELIFSEDAPVAEGDVPLTEGKSGPAVQKLQQALKDMGLYAGEIDSIMDLEVSQAIEKFQVACGYGTSSKVSPEVQHAVYYQQEQLESTFGTGGIPAPEFITEEMWQGTIEAKANIIIRAQKSTDSKEMGKAMIGDNVVVMALEGEWAHIYANGVSGYIYKKYLVNPVTRTNYVLKYSADGREYLIGRTLEQALQGVQSPASLMADAIASRTYLEESDEVRISYVTVETGSDGVRLNLRAEPSAEGEVLMEIDNGTSMRVVSQGEEWTCVGYEGEIGYLMNQYLSFWEGDEEALAEQYVTLDNLTDAGVTLDDMGGSATAVVVAPKEGKPYLYTKAALSSDKYATMSVGIEVEVVGYAKEVSGAEDHWLKVRYLGQTGYMRSSCLQFEYEGA